MCILTVTEVTQSYDGDGSSTSQEKTGLHSAWGGTSGQNLDGNRLYNPKIEE